MKYIIIISIATSLLNFSCNGNDSVSDQNSTTGSESSYEENVVSVEQEEQRYPLRFLSTDGTYRKNLLGEWVCEGKISSEATVAVYKDIRIQISFYSKTETLIGTEDHIIYEYIKPGRSKSFKIKTYADGIGGQPTTLGWEIIDAGVDN